jgi:AraC family transcriptional regulator, positive regulator of tynA and feaB
MQPLTLTFSTDTVHPRDRFDFWHSIACKSYVEHECDPNERRRFEGHVDIAPLAHTSLSTYSNTPARIWRTQRQVARAHSDDLFLCLQISGTCTISQDGRDASLQPGDFCLADTAGEYAFTYPVNSSQLVLKIERPRLKARLPHFRSLMAVPVRSCDPTGALAFEFIGMLPRYRDAITGVAELRIADQAVDLAALALSTVAEASGLKLSSASAAALLRLRRAVEAALAQRGMRCADVAAAAGMSVRYANHLLRQDGTSLERYLQHRRLEKCRDALRDPGQSHRSISEIAFAWGFSDASHFTRSFKAAYGLAPRDYRREG